MPQPTTPRELFAAGIDRRRVPRYSCSGQAQVTSLPLNGLLLKGKVRDLGLGGCCIECVETTSPFDLGAPTEILVKVNSWFFRAMAQVRAIHGRSGVSMEFMRMSAGGYNMLADLIADLQPRTGATRQDRLLEHSRQLLRNQSSLESSPGSALNHSLAIVGTILPPSSTAEPSATANHHAWVQALYPGATSLDIFV